MTYEARMVDHAVDFLRQSRINWDKAEKEGLPEGYMHEVQQKLAPRMCRVHDGVDQLSQEMGEVADILVETAERLLPWVQPKGCSKWKDEVLSCFMCPE